MVTREGWLNGAVDAFRPWFHDAGHPLPNDVKVSIGFGAKRKSLGECWSDEAASDGLRHIFISPMIVARDSHDLSGPQGILATLIHECVHAALPHKVGHKRPFQILADKIGLVEPWTATTASEPLQVSLKRIADELGSFPSGHLSLMGKDKAQKNRHHKCECGECGYIARVAKKHLTEMGSPLCPMGHGPMSNPLASGEDENPEDGE